MVISKNYGTLYLLCQDDIRACKKEDRLVYQLHTDCQSEGY